MNGRYGSMMLGRQHAGRDAWRVALDRGADRLTVEAELGRDGPHLPVLGVVQAPDLGALRGRDHPSSSSPRGAARASAPATGSSARRPRIGWRRGAEPGRRQGRGVWPIAALRGKTDPSRGGGGRGRRAAGRDGRDGPRDCAGVAPGQPAPSGDGRPPGSAASSRRGRGRTPRRWRTNGCSVGRFFWRNGWSTASERAGKLRLDSAPPAVAQQWRPARSVGARGGHEGPAYFRALTPRLSPLQRYPTAVEPRQPGGRPGLPAVRYARRSRRG